MFPRVHLRSSQPRLTRAAKEESPEKRMRRIASQIFSSEYVNLMQSQKYKCRSNAEGGELVICDAAAVSPGYHRAVRAGERNNYCTKHMQTNEDNIFITLTEHGFINTWKHVN